MTVTITDDDGNATDDCARVRGRDHQRQRLLGMDAHAGCAGPVRGCGALKRGFLPSQERRKQGYARKPPPDTGGGFRVGLVPSPYKGRGGASRCAGEGTAGAGCPAPSFQRRLESRGEARGAPVVPAEAGTSPSVPCGAGAASRALRGCDTRPFRSRPTTAYAASGGRWRARARRPLSIQASEQF